MSLVTKLVSENEKLRMSMDAFVSEATLLPEFEEIPKAWRDFVLEFIWSFNKVLETYDEKE